MPPDKLEVIFAIFFCIFHSSVFENLNKETVVLVSLTIAYTISVGAYTDPSPSMLLLEASWLK